MTRCATGRRTTPDANSRSGPGSFKPVAFPGFEDSPIAMAQQRTSPSSHPDIRLVKRAGGLLNFANHRFRVLPAKRLTIHPEHNRWATWQIAMNPNPATLIFSVHRERGSADPYRMLKRGADWYARSRFGRGWRGVRFLCFHSVVGSQVLPSTLFTPTMTSARFRRQLEWIAESGYQVVSMPQALSRLESGSAREGQYLVVTFDDGYLDNWQIAWPILKSLGFIAHFFIVTDWIGVKDHIQVGGRTTPREFMGQQELVELVREGGTVGSHSHTHLNLVEQAVDDVEEDLTRSREMLSALVRSPVTTLAYPYAAYNQRVLRAAQTAVHRYSFKIDLGRVVQITEGNRHLLPRTLVNGEGEEEIEY